METVKDYYKSLIMFLISQNGYIVDFYIAINFHEIYILMKNDLTCNGNEAMKLISKTIKRVFSRFKTFIAFFSWYLLKSAQFLKM